MQKGESSFGELIDIEGFDGTRKTIRNSSVPLRGPKVYLDVSIAYLKGQVLSPPARAFVDTLIGLKSEDLHPMGIGLLTAKILSQRKEQQRQSCLQSGDAIL